MSGMFTGCTDCCPVPECFSVTRRIGGFAEYSITHDTDNPVTYFIGRKYRTAVYSFTLTDSSAGTCGGATVNLQPNHASCAFTGKCEFTSLANVPSYFQTGINAFGDIDPFDTSFQPDGWYQIYFNDGRGSGFGAFGLNMGGAFPGLATHANSHYDFNAMPDCLTINGIPGGGTQSGSFIVGMFNATAPPCNPNGSTFVVYGCSGATSGTDDGALTGTSTGATGGMSSNVYTGSISVDCDLTVSTIELLPGDNHCELYFDFNLKIDAAASGTLSNEIDYTAIFDSVIAAADAIPTLYSSPVPKNSGFVDYPVQDGDWTINPSTIANFGTVQAHAGLVFNNYLNDFCVPNDGESATGSAPSVAHHYFSTAFYEIGNPDTPGFDPFDTFACVIKMTNPAVSTPYIIVTYIVMNDFSLVLDTYGSGPCVDGVSTGRVTVPTPSPYSLPSALCTTGGGGELNGPIGRMNVMILGTTCATWDGTLPT